MVYGLIIYFYGVDFVIVDLVCFNVRLEFMLFIIVMLVMVVQVGFYFKLCLYIFVVFCFNVCFVFLGMVGIFYIYLGDLCLWLDVLGIQCFFVVVKCFCFKGIFIFNRGCYIVRIIVVSRMVIGIDVVIKLVIQCLVVNISVGFICIVLILGCVQFSVVIVDVFI